MESTAGIGEGARTGLSSIVVAVLFALAVLITPFFDSSAPTFGTSMLLPCPPWVVVGAMMMKSAAQIHWDDLEEALPAS